MKTEDLRLKKRKGEVETVTPENFTIVCETHGTNEWEGHFCCSECFMTYTNEEAEIIENDNDGLCLCGRKLLPEDDNDQDFTGVAVCTYCFVELRKKATLQRLLKKKGAKKQSGKG